MKTHFMNEETFKKESWKCDNCGNMDTINHIKYCHAYEKLRMKNNYLKSDKDTVNYYKDVIAPRDNSIKEAL